MVALLAWWALSVSAVAGPFEYRACCDAVGEGSCPETVRASGPGTQSLSESGATRLTGLWRLACADGVRFDDGATTATKVVPVDGTVVDRLHSGATACWNAACALPDGLCMQWSGQAARLVTCTGSGVPNITAWARPASAAWTPVVIGGDKVLRATLSEAGAPPTRSAAPGPTAAPPAPAIDTRDLDLSVPDPAPDPCRPNGALMAASNQQHGEGNQAAMQLQWGLALGKYRAAIAINACNAFAWADLGEAFLQVNEPTRARQSLEVATRLMPKHYRAWANRGLAEEKSGRRSEALAAYQRALDLEPDDLIARQGLERVRR